MADKCRGCGQAIQFIRTPRGADMPCGVRKLTIVTDRGEVVQGFAPHWAECPSAKSFKQPKARTTPDGEMSRRAGRAMFQELREQLELAGADGDKDKGEGHGEE